MKQTEERANQRLLILQKIYVDLLLFSEIAYILNICYPSYSLSDSILLNIIVKNVNDIIRQWLLSE